jgi:hypothetical protein
LAKADAVEATVADLEIRRLVRPRRRRVDDGVAKRAALDTRVEFGLRQNASRRWRG